MGGRLSKVNKTNRTLPAVVAAEAAMTHHEDYDRPANYSSG
jgi:hypothetical protein